MTFLVSYCLNVLCIVASIFFLARVHNAVFPQTILIVKKRLHFVLGVRVQAASLRRF